MRTIKFNAFIKLNSEGLDFYHEKECLFVQSKTHHVLSIDFYGRSICIRDEGEKSVLTIFQDFCESFQLLEFTGLTDKNGIEIYEGDILAGSMNLDIDKIDYESAFCVDFANGSFNIGVESKSELIKIGNIHENPELL